MDGIKTFAGNLELIKSEMVHISGNDILTISLQEVMFLKFEFVTDDKDKNSFISKEVIEDKKTLVIKCANFDNSLGQGLIEPLEIGYFNNRKLYFSFFVWTPNINQNKRLINYSLYLEK